VVLNIAIPIATGAIPARPLATLLALYISVLMTYAYFELKLRYPFNENQAKKVA